MSARPTSPTEPIEGDHRHLVQVELVTTDEQGDTQTATLEIDSGPTKVTALKSELGIPEDSALWVIHADGKRKPLGDHETYNVKAGDRFEAIVRGGVS